MALRGITYGCLLLASVAALVWVLLLESGDPARLDAHAMTPAQRMEWHEPAVITPRVIRFTMLDPVEQPFQDRYFPFLADEDSTASVSVGTVTTGFQVGAVAISQSAMHYQILPRQAARGLPYGTRELIELIEGAAARVAEQFPGTRLWLGNVGAQRGGDIAWSVSHNSGRDADLAFYFVDTEGHPMAPPDLLGVRVNQTASRNGLTYRFDVARNWALVQALLENADTQIQFLFIANRLEESLLQHAREIGADPVVLERAQVVMSQPGRSNPHDDHLHVRIYCNEQDVALGCENIGTIHPWVDTFAETRRARVASIRGFLRNGAAEQRARALERLLLMGEAERSEALVALSDVSSRVRAAALRSLRRVGRVSNSSELVALWAHERDGEVRAELIQTVTELGGPQATELLLGSLASPLQVRLNGRSVDLRALIADGLASLEVEASIPALVDLLASPDPYLRSRADWALRRLANTTHGTTWADTRLDRNTVSRGLTAWESWWDVNQSGSRQTWVDAGFARMQDATDTEGLDQIGLVAAVGSEELFIRHNAQRELLNETGRDVPCLTWPTSDATWYWHDAVR